MMFYNAWDVIHRKGVGLSSIAGEQGTQLPWGSMVFSMVLARGSDKTAAETKEVAADLQALKLKNS